VAVEPDALHQSPQAETYKQFVRENWDKLAPWEQRQAEAFLAADNGVGEFVAGVPVAPSSSQPFLNEPRKPIDHPELFWTVRIGWICALATLISPFFFGPLGTFFGVYNIWKGEHEKGIMQVGLSLVLFVLMIIMLMASFELLGRLIPGPKYLVS
jgi:hypothetical protein